MLKYLIISLVALSINLQAGISQEYLKISNQHYQIFKKLLPLDSELQQEFSQLMKNQNQQRELLIRSAQAGDDALLELLKERKEKTKLFSADKNSKNRQDLAKVNRKILIHILDHTRTREDQREAYNSWVDAITKANDWCLKVITEKLASDAPAYTEINTTRAALLKTK